MPAKHVKGDIIVPNFLPSGGGRDLYLDCSLAEGKAFGRPKPVTYKDSETGATRTLYWWTKLPAGGEYKQKFRRQQDMASRLSQQPASKQGHRSLSRTQRRENIEAQIALEKFNPWSVHQTTLRNWAVTHGMSRAPSRFEPGRSLLGMTDVIM